MKGTYSKHYSEKSLFEKLAKFAKMAGSKVIYAVLLLYYLMIDSKTAIRTRISIAAALGYFIFPLDAIPDLTPVLGYTDDLGVLIFALTQFSASITDVIREKAKEQLSKWIAMPDINDLNDVDSRIKVVK